MAYHFVAGDTGSKLVATCMQQGTKDILTLESCAATLRFWYQDDSSVRSRSMTIRTPASAGVAEYLFQAGELKAGRLFCEVEVVDQEGKLVSQLEEVAYNVRAKHNAP